LFHKCSRSNAPICLVHVPYGFPTRHISHSVPVAPCATHLRLAPRAQHVQPLKVPVCKPVHVQHLAVACSDGTGLLGLALALRARADIEVCAVEENAAALQGGSADGMARSWPRPPLANKQIRLKDPDARMVGEGPRAFTHQGRPWVLPVVRRPLLPPAERTT
jgi:hypothetical protein